MSKIAIISAAGWKGCGFQQGLPDCPEPFLPLGDGTTTLSRAAATFHQLGFDICIALAQYGYPYKKYHELRRDHTCRTLEVMGLSGDDSPWTQERTDYASQFGEIIEIPDPGWASTCDTFSVAMDYLGVHNCERWVLAMGDMLMSEGYLEAIMELPWPSQYTFSSGHSYLLLDVAGATFYREYVEPMRRWASWIERHKVSLYQPAGHPHGTSAMARGGIPTYGAHNGPRGKWWDIDTPTRYAKALEMVKDGMFTWRRVDERDKL